MNNEAAASWPRDGGGSSQSEPGIARPLDIAVPPFSHSLCPSSPLCNPSPQISRDQFEAFETAVNSCGIHAQQVEHISNRMDDAIASAEVSRKSSDADRIILRPDGTVDRGSGSNGESGHFKTSKGETTPSPMVIDSVKGVRKRTSNEALDHLNDSAASKSLKADLTQNPPKEKRDIPIASSSNLNTNSTSDKQPLRHNPDSVKYSTEDKAPFVVYIYSKNNNNNNSSNEAAHPLLVSKLISNIAYNDIIELKKIGRGKIMAELKSAKSANNLVSSSLLDTNNLKAFIPAFRTLRTGIVKDIPPSISVESIHKAIEAPSFKILEITRFNRRIHVDGVAKTVPSSTISIKFAGQVLPKHIFLFKTRHEVSPFVPKTKVCFNCYRVGHISASCKSSPRCLKCGQNKHADENSCPATASPPSCINCKGAHLATSPDCPIIARQSAIVSLAAINNIPLFEARRFVNQGHYPSNASSPHVSSPISSISQAHNHYNHSPPQSKDPRFDFQNFPFLHNNSHAGSSNHTHDSNGQLFFQSNNRFDLLNSEEHHSYAPGQSPGFGHGSYANVASGRSSQSPNSRFGTSTRSIHNAYSYNQAPSHLSKDGLPTEAPQGRLSSSPPPSQPGLRADPGRQFHFYPNGRTPFSSRNGVANDIHSSTTNTSSNPNPNGSSDFVRNFSSFFFQELFPLLLKGEYSAVFDTSLKFILNYFNMNPSASTTGYRHNSSNDSNITTNSFPPAARLTGGDISDINYNTSDPTYPWSRSADQAA